MPWHDRAVPARPRPYHHGNLRQALLQAAERRLERHGAAATTLRAIARDAHVTHAAAYHHFADREALLRALAARGYERFAAALAGAAARAPGPRAFLEVGVAYVRFAADHPALFRLMFSGEVARGRRADAELRAAADGALGVLLEGVRGGAPGLDEAAVRRRAAAAWAVVHGISGLFLDGQLAPLGLAEDPELLAREILSGEAPPPRR
jgi:AcrR family transcriptional regulator